MTKTLIKLTYSLGIVAVILTLAALSAVWFLPREQWYYRVETYEISLTEDWTTTVEQQFNDIGDQNWELFEVHTLPTDTAEETLITTYWRKKCFE